MSFPQFPIGSKVRVTKDWRDPDHRNIIGMVGTLTGQEHPDYDGDMIYCVHFDKSYDRQGCPDDEVWVKAVELVTETSEESNTIEIDMLEMYDTLGCSRGMLRDVVEFLRSKGVKVV